MNRGRRDRRRSQKEKTKGNAVHYSGPIVKGQCKFGVLVGHPRALNPAKGVDSTLLQDAEALIDTGATISCIHPDLAAKLELKPTTLAQLGGIGEGRTTAPVAPLLVGFPPQGGKKGIARIIPVAIVKTPSPLLFGMDQILPGVLVVDGKLMTWDWKLPNAVVYQQKGKARA